MLDPDLVLEAVVSAFRSIPELVQEMADDQANIVGHAYSYGVENSLARAVFGMRSPSILVAYLDILGGNFSGMSVWKHRLECYIRPKNAAMGNVAGGAPAASPPHLWWLMINKPINGGVQNIRYVDVLPGLWITDNLPPLTHQTDEQLADFFVGHLTFTETGDA